MTTTKRVFLTTLYGIKFKGLRMKRRRVVFGFQIIYYHRFSENKPFTMILYSLAKSIARTVPTLACLF